jgi:hypothetical protein
MMTNTAIEKAHYIGSRGRVDVFNSIKWKQSAFEMSSGLKAPSQNNIV